MATGIIVVNIRRMLGEVGELILLAHREKLVSFYVFVSEKDCYLPLLRTFLGRRLTVSDAKASPNQPC